MTTTHLIVIYPCKLGSEKRFIHSHPARNIWKTSAYTVFFKCTASPHGLYNSSSSSAMSLTAICSSRETMVLDCGSTADLCGVSAACNSSCLFRRLASTRCCCSCCNLAIHRTAWCQWNTSFSEVIHPTALTQHCSVTTEMNKWINKCFWDTSTLGSFCTKCVVAEFS